MKSLLRDVTPPILWRTASKARQTIAKARSHEPSFEYGVEQAADFYDFSFEQAQHWKDHYIDSPYYFLWTVIADRIRRLGVEKVLDIGCGPGQVACLVRDAGVPAYKGLDFSPARIAQARAVCPNYEFVAESIFESDVLEAYDYDCVMLMEFLEHIEQDTDVLARIRAGTTILATVPNFPARGHVRYFADAGEVERRYSPWFSRLDVTVVPASTKGKTYYIMEGVRRATSAGGSASEEVV